MPPITTLTPAQLRQRTSDPRYWHNDDCSMPAFVYEEEPMEARDKTPVSDRVWVRHIWLHKRQFPEEAINDVLEDIYEMGGILVDIKFAPEPERDSQENSPEGYYGQVLILHRFPAATD